MIAHGTVEKQELDRTRDRCGRLGLLHGRRTDTALDLGSPRATEGASGPDEQLVEGGLPGVEGSAIVDEGDDDFDEEDGEELSGQRGFSSAGSRVGEK